MKRFILPLLMAAALTSCSTFQYSSRSVDVNNRSIGTKETAAEVVVDYGRTVTATSDFQLTKNEAIREAEYLCIQNSKIDVVVDPVFKIEYSPFELKRKYRATVTGFAGMYKSVPAGVDAVKKYDMEDIEKYKLLTDPSFPQHYYNNGTGDNYYINSSNGQMVKSAGAASLAFAPKAKTPKPLKDFDLTKARKLRNAGMGLTIAGAIATLVIGVPCISTAGEEYYDSRYGYMYNVNEEQHAAGLFFTIVGSITTVAGIPTWCIGSSRMKKSGADARLSVGGTKNGMGLRLKF